MGDIIGSKSKMIQIPVPTGRKIRGKITDLKLSDKFENCINVKIEFPQYKKRLENGKEFTKQAFYTISVDWSEKNKGGKLLFSLYGKYPQSETVNWSKALLGREVDCIFKNALDENGNVAGQKIEWIGKAGAAIEPATGPLPALDIEEPTADFDSPEYSGDPEVDDENVI